MRFPHALALLLLTPALVIAADRSASAKYQFRKANPCPTNPRLTGPCPGFRIDHRIALVCGGSDNPDNMQWLSVEVHTEKTRRDVRTCRAQR